MSKIEKINNELYKIQTTMAYVEAEEVLDIYTNSYLIIGTKGLAVVDAGSTKTGEQVLTLLSDLAIDKSRLRAIIVTHAHGDHVGSAADLRDETGCMIVVHKDGAELMRNLELMFWDFMQSFPMQFPFTEKMHDMWFDIANKPASPDILYKDGFALDLGNIVLQAIPTPGHSVDSICVYEPNKHWLFTGDSIQGFGDFTNTPCYRDATIYRDSITKLTKLQVDQLFPAHLPEMNHDEAQKYLESSLENVDRADALVREALKKAGKPATIEELARDISPKMGKPYQIQSLMLVKGHLLELERLGIVTKYGCEEAMYSLHG
jgi:glyoxylase-like metal-dependent hydrolase (beta-lactamase superfamily II)